MSNKTSDLEKVNSSANKILDATRGMDLDSSIAAITTVLAKLTSNQEGRTACMVISGGHADVDKRERTFMFCTFNEEMAAAFFDVMVTKFGFERVQ